jgi:hypothetical protein
MDTLGLEKILSLIERCPDCTGCLKHVIMVSLASWSEVRFVPPPPVKYSTLDTSCFCRYEWGYPVQNSLYFNANVSVVLWRGSFVDFKRWFWVHSGSGLTVQLGRAWCTLPVSGWVWHRLRLQVLLALIQSPLAEKKQRWPPVFASNIKIICI